MSQAFMDNQSQLLPGMWIFDCTSGSLFSGLPDITFIIRDAVVRSPVKAAVDDWSDTLIARQELDDVLLKYNDLSDASEVMREFTEDAAAADVYAAGNLALLRGRMMVIAKKVKFHLPLSIKKQRENRSVHQTSTAISKHCKLTRKAYREFVQHPKPLSTKRCAPTL